MFQKFLFATCVTHDTPCDLLYSRHPTPQHRQSTKNRIWKTTWKVIPKIQLLNWRLQFQIQINRVNKQKSLKKNQKRSSKEEVDSSLRENNINTVPEELVSSENTIRYIPMIGIIAADDGWSIPSTFSPQTFEQLEVN